MLKWGGPAAKVARDDIEKNLGHSVVSKDSALAYKYVEDDLMIEKKMCDMKKNTFCDLLLGPKKLMNSYGDIK